jgi:adenylosuccinate lyase
MALVWSEERKLEAWLQVEVAASEALAEQGVVPGADLAAIKQARPPDPEAVRER